MKTGTILGDKLPDGFQQLNEVLPLRAIQGDVDLENAHEVADRLAVLDTRTADQEAYLETLSILIEKYEDEHHVIGTEDLDPIGTLEFLMEQHGMNASDLGRLLGQRQLGPKILSGDRDLSKAHIQALAAHFGVSPAVFLKLVE